jgi:hypothetical protein
MIVLLATLWWSGCDECVDGETRCSGDGIASCVRGRFRAISFCCAQDGCRDVLVDELQTAVCSPTDQPDPRCEGAAPIDNICVDGPASLHCDAGYGSYEQVCARVCVEPEPGFGFCALAEVPDPRCAASGPADRCDGDRIVSCTLGFATAEQPCAAPFETCMLVPDNLGGSHPRCATAQPDPACATDSPGRCDGRDIYSCRGGRRTFESCAHACYENPIDSRFPEAFCEGPSCSIED